jgi:glycosyltransferase involved in cell wall biosynthesis
VKAVILMSRMSDYMLNCFTAWQRSSGVELHIVRMKENANEAPFQFGTEYSGIAFHAREEMSATDIQCLIERERPGLIICFGWFDSAYVAAVKARPAGVVAVMTMDNQWHRSARQLAGAMYGRLFLVRHFDFIWVPGAPQRRFARILGFPDWKIREGLYVANDTNFTPLYQTIERAPRKRLVFVGRYVDVKGLGELWDAFEAYHAANDSSLELLCIGTGPLYKDRHQHPRIKHLGFVQPSDFSEKLSGGGIFILPSKFEPWGVVVHEFALAGFPLILSSAVGAASRFLSAVNGCVVDSTASLLAAIAFIDGLDNEALAKMSEASREKGLGLSVTDWCRQANEFMEYRKCDSQNDGH